ncbi:hypothetical protein ACLQ2S_25375 [Micromonospora sp. DT48]|uniref:hypothetical protein n=1 Tax=unclassified Micromonospora TaxID=2617518 RepID=UPI0012BD4B1C|nr:hypothetical protein [Micromonospora sp. CP22]MTK03132.1 hypothetical protein [Micromonospora sp. CP22]
MIAYIRTMVKGEHAENDRIEARLDDQGWEGFGTLLGAVFYFAVNRRFPDGASPDEVIRFVSEMRRMTTGGPETDATSAEKLIMAALDPSIDTDIDPHVAGRVQGLTILHTLGADTVSDEELDALLTEAAALASRI